MVTIITWIIMGGAAALGGILMKLGWKKVTKNEAQLQALHGQVQSLMGDTSEEGPGPATPQGPAQGL
jgi:hypothetical protein